MIRITYKTDISFKDIIKKIDIKSQTIEAEVMKLGIFTAEKMKSTIIQNKVRPQAGQPPKLENSIDMERIQEGQNIIGWGVGNISRMDKEAPYWKAVNWGSSHIVGKEFYGFFHPGEEHPDISHFREGRFFEDKQFGWKMTPKNPIPPMNYIEKTVAWFDSAIIKITAILKR